MYLLHGIEVQVGCTTYPKFRFHLSLLRPVVNGDGISKAKRGEKEKTHVCGPPFMNQSWLIV